MFTSAIARASLIIAVATLPLTAAPAQAREHHRMIKVCRHSSGTTGLIAGGGVGALAGHALIGGPVGIVAGAVGGAFGGRAIDRTISAKKRCHYEEVTTGEPVHRR